MYESSPRTQTISGESFQSCGLVKIYRTANVSEQPTRNETVQGGGSLGNALPTLVTRRGGGHEYLSQMPAQAPAGTLKGLRERLE